MWQLGEFLQKKDAEITWFPYHVNRPVFLAFLSRKRRQIDEAR
jgi:hypothetical protein